MNGWSVSTLVSLSLIAVAPCTAQDAPRKQETWLSDYSRARAVARSAGKPMMVVFR